MEANAPEKIYLIRNISTPTSLNTTNDCHEKYLQEWYKEREKDADVEYTRTDALMKRAEEWLNEHAEDNDYTWYDETEHTSGITEKFIEDLLNYLKE